MPTRKPLVRYLCIALAATATVAILGIALAAIGSDRHRTVRGPSRGAYTSIDTSGLKHALAVFSGTDQRAKERLLSRIKSRPGNFAPPVFFLAAHQLQAKGERADAYFWFCFGRLRARYDAVRCSDVSARSGVDVLVLKTDPKIRAYVAEIPFDKIMQFGHRLLELDRATPYNYDHRWIALHGMDAMVPGTKNLCVPEAQWPELASKVRQAFLADLRAAEVALKEKSHAP